MNQPEENPIYARPNPINQIQSSDTSSFGMITYQNWAIVVLVGLLILSFLGINILLVIGNFFQSIINAFGPLVYQILGVFGYTAGSVINKTADIAGDTAKAGVDIAEGTVQSVGNLLLKSSGTVVDPAARSQLDTAMNAKIRIPMPTQTVNVPVPVPVPVPTPVPTPSSNNQSSKSLDNYLNNPVTRFFGYETASPSPSYSIPSSDSASSKIQSPIASNKTAWCLVGEDNGRRTCIDVQDQTKCLSGQIYPSQQDCLSIQPDSSTLGQNKMTASNPIIPNMNSNIISYGNGTMMMNGLPMPQPQPQLPQNMDVTTIEPSPLELPQMIGNGPLPSQKNAGFPNTLAPLPNNSKFITSVPAQPLIIQTPAANPSPASMDPNVIQADGPPIGNGNGPVNYFYSYSTRSSD